VVNDPWDNPHLYEGRGGTEKRNDTLRLAAWLRLGYSTSGVAAFSQVIVAMTTHRIDPILALLGQPAPIVVTADQFAVLENLARRGAAAAAV
jgi:hypothetical protein